MIENFQNAENISQRQNLTLICVCDVSDEGRKNTTVQKTDKAKMMSTRHKEPNESTAVGANEADIDNAKMMGDLTQESTVVGSTGGGMEERELTVVIRNRVDAHFCYSAGSNDVDASRKCRIVNNVGGSAVMSRVW